MQRQCYFFFGEKSLTKRYNLIKFLLKYHVHSNKESVGLIEKVVESKTGTGSFKTYVTQEGREWGQGKKSKKA